MKARNNVPCLIFSGQSEKQLLLDLSESNRITFETDGMTVSSSTNPESSRQLSYSLYHHIEIGDGIPDDFSGINDIITDINSNLIFISTTKSITVESTSEMPFKIGIFNINGTLIAYSTVNAGQNLSLEGVTPGTYIATATDGISKLTLKFILK